MCIYVHVYQNTFVRMFRSKMVVEQMRVTLPSHIQIGITTKLETNQPE